jgi:hypothetical protein
MPANKQRYDLQRRPRAHIAIAALGRHAACHGEEALEWVRRCPDPMPGEESEIEIRPVYEAEDFGKELAPELRIQEQRLRAAIERQRRS